MVLVGPMVSAARGRRSVEPPDSRMELPWLFGAGEMASVSIYAVVFGGGDGLELEALLMTDVCRR